jgi:alcohol dehydrogenase class IV
MAAEMGDHAILVTGSSIDRVGALVQQLKDHGIKLTQFSVIREPTTKVALEGAQKARISGCDIVIAVGGGSVIDTGKVIAALLTNSGELMDYLEVIGAGQPLAHHPAPCIAIPTTAGTGAEVTCNSVLGSPEHRVKVSMRSPMMFPRLAVVDPILTYSIPPTITAVTGLDAFSQLLEAFVSNRANPMTDSLCREGLHRAARSLQRVYQDGSIVTAREDMCIASLFGGIALANAKLGAVHGIAGPLGGMFPAAHGALCARLLPCVMEANITALRLRAPDSPALKRYDEIARIITGAFAATAEDGIKWVQKLCGALKSPVLSAHGLKESDFPAVVEKSQKASSMQGNPIKLTSEELNGILHAAI